MLEDLGLAGEGAPPRLEVWNKVDLLDEELHARALERAAAADAIAISAAYGEGVEELRERVGKALDPDRETRRINLSVSDGARISWLHANGNVTDSSVDGEKMTLQVELSDRDWNRFEAL